MGHVSGTVLGVYTEDVNVGPDAELPADAASELDSTPPIHRTRIYLTSKNFQTYVLITLSK